MLGGFSGKWVHLCIAKYNLLDISKIRATGFTFTNHPFLIPSDYHSNFILPTWRCFWKFHYERNYSVYSLRKKPDKLFYRAVSPHIIFRWSPELFYWFSLNKIKEYYHIAPFSITGTILSPKVDFLFREIINENEIKQ